MMFPLDVSRTYQGELAEVPMRRGLLNAGGEEILRAGAPAGSR
jgi:hypothetical protein